jgi:thioredoxin 1
MTSEYLNPGPTREEIDATPGAVLLEFGTGWCGYCQRAAPVVAEALRDYPGVQSKTAPAAASAGRFA